MTTSAASSSSRAEDHSRCHEVHGLEDAERLPLLPPALNYYLLATWPGEYRDDQQSRYINERVHANIQKDGTYSVVPRMWGGVTTPNELRAIADCRRQVQYPDREGHGGQRIDLLGVKKEDLPAVWADLNDAGMVSRPRLRQGLADRENLRRFGMVPLRHPGFDRARHQDREVHVGLVDAGQGEARRVRLSAQLRGSDLQGRRRYLRRFRLRDPFRRRRRPSHQGHRVSSPRSRPRRRRSKSSPR
jgi:hypothetical protein